MQYPGRINPGETFGRLTAVKFIRKEYPYIVIWEFLCKCGKTITAKAGEFNGDFTELIPHGDYVVVSATDMGCGDILYKLVAKGKPKNYPHLLQV